MTPNDSDKRILSTEHEYNSVSFGGINTETVRIELESIEYENLEITGAVPVEDLEVLADEWEGNKFYAAGEDYAQELREVIENHDS